MRIPWLIGALLLASCREPTPAADPTAAPSAANAAAAAAPAAQAGWDLQSSGEGTALALLDDSGATVLRLFCPAGANRLLVNVPRFEPIGSEERLSFGGGGDVVALVADPSGDRQRGGVSGTGATPENLAALLSGTVSASYGAQTSGPHSAPSSEQARALVRACSENASKPAQAPRPEPQPQPEPRPQPAHPCQIQDGKPLPPIQLKAIGTEPFWGARIEGRCVTYSHPEDQNGTRVWTSFSGSAAQGSWTGALNGQPFVLLTQPQPGCSDGMSDRRYPIAVALTVNGEQRRGCAQRP